MILAGTGHRSNKLFKHDAYSKDNLKHLIKFAKIQLLKHDPDEVISGLALGWDQALALAALGLNIPLIAAVPCYNQDSGWGPAYQKLYKELLEKSDKVIYVHKGSYNNSCMLNRNIFMVDNSDEVLALWNGDFTGGTTHCYNYAIKQGKPIHNTWDEWIEYKEANQVQ
jgi:uncharacterized phage-like protein YoqJ